jgi:hypothetical protein
MRWLRPNIGDIWWVLIANTKIDATLLKLKQLFAEVVIGSKF